MENTWNNPLIWLQRTITTRLWMTEVWLIHHSQWGSGKPCKTAPPCCKAKQASENISCEHLQQNNLQSVNTSTSLLASIYPYKMPYNMLLKCHIYSNTTCTFLHELLHTIFKALLKGSKPCYTLQDMRSHVYRSIAGCTCLFSIFLNTAPFTQSIYFNLWQVPCPDNLETPQLSLLKINHLHSARKWKF